mmetsp:Transcript_32011/g.66830  ORF Transcript_32011/g.66830 Transcript_32011/m.66830 type:complete len:241 (+) Transcript_32011:292-1014(+)
MGLPAPPTPEEYFAQQEKKQGKKQPEEEPKPSNPYFDPEQWITNPPQTFVQIQNTSRDELNGHLALVVGYQQGAGGRYIVHLCLEQTKASFRVEKLKRCNALLSLLGQVQIVRYNPDVQQGVADALESVGGVKIAVAAAVAFLLLFVASIYFLGFSKTMTLMALALILIMMMGPDVMKVLSKDDMTWTQVVRNIPRHGQGLIREFFPGGPIGERIASSTWSTILFWFTIGAYAVWALFVR